MLKYGEDVDERIQNTFRHTFGSVINFLFEPNMVTAKSTVYDFLTSSVEKKVKFDKFLHYAKSADYIISFYKQRLENRENRHEFLFTYGLKQK